MFWKTLSRGAGRFFSKQKDYYSILGVTKSADSAEIKKAFAKLARELHPDRNPAPGAKEKFAEVSEAYQTLSDESKRKVYDSYNMGGSAQGGSASGFGGAPDFGNFSDFFGQGSGFSDFEDFFSAGGQRNQRKTLRGSDVNLSVELEFLEAVKGTKKEVSYKVTDECDTCKGSKCKPGTSASSCASCKGKGTTTVRQGPMTIQLTCKPCDGAGSVISSPCTACKGQGQVQKTAHESVDFPAGINTGQTVRVSGKGNAGQVANQKGDLIVKVSVRPDKYFRREDFNVVSDLVITISQAALGTEAEIKTLTGSKKVKIPQGVAHGARIRIPGEGIARMPPRENEKGDHFVVVNIAIPTKLSTTQRALYEELKNLDLKK